LAKRTFLQLAHKYDSKKHGIGGWFLSEKLDGMRAFWDGGVTTGMLKSTVPWANTTKDARYKDLPIASGLWSRYGNVIHAPKWWTDQLPRIPLDGEVYCPTLTRQEIMSIVKKSVDVNEFTWNEITLNCFDIPKLSAVFEDGMINETNFKKSFMGCYTWILEQNFNYEHWGIQRFESAYHVLGRFLENCEVAIRHPQFLLPFQTEEAEKIINEQLLSVEASGGEGLIVRNPSALWWPERVHDILKIKKLDDAEGIVTGYTTGRKTDKGSKLLGKMGALILECPVNKIATQPYCLELSGFTDAERTFSTQTMTSWAMDHPDQECPDWVINADFPVGSEVTFKYRGLSKEGVPQEARYFRKRIPE